MEWLSVSVKILIVTSSLLFFAKTTTSMAVNYVKPFSSKVTSPCSSEQRSCLTLNEYASNSRRYFVNNTIFYFYPSIHRLDYSLVLENLYNFSFHGWPSGDQVITIAIDSLAKITWNESWNIEISSIGFILHDNFTFILRFEHSQFVQLSNISIYGNGYSGRSSIIGQGGALNIKNSIFIGINGFLGAAIMMVASNITFGESNLFANNTAASGGSIYLSDSRLTLNGVSLFLNNTCTIILRYYYSEEWVTRKMSLYNHVEEFIAGRCGGAIFMDSGDLTIQANASFRWNTANGDGGAMQLNYTSSNISGNLSVNKNKASCGGVISVVGGNFIIRGYTSFNENFDSCGGSALDIAYTNFKYENMNNVAIFNENYNYSAISSIHSNITFIGTIYFYKNIGFKGGVIRGYDSNVIFSGTIKFSKNMAVFSGAMFLVGASKLIFMPKLSISFILNHANDSGGALYFEDYQCSLGSTVPIECFITIGGSFISSTSINISLHFENNSAEKTGSILYGGQLDECKLFFRNSTEVDQCDCKAQNYRDNALETLIMMSTNHNFLGNRK